MRRQDVGRAQHWVVKVGSNVLLREGLALDRPVFVGLVQDLDALMRRGHRVTLVSSGAVALGRQVLGSNTPKPREIPALQALAALGQSRLMGAWESEFAFYDRPVAQVLFSRGDLGERARYLNARRAMDALHEMGAVPVINENDTVATEELKFGDNDQLAAMTAGVVGADLLVILSDVEGIYEVERGVFGARIPEEDVFSERLDVLAGPPAPGVGTGGMRSKVAAARIAARVGVSTVIAPGKQAGVLASLASGEDVGTWLSDESGESALAGRKVWLEAGARAVGRVHCDAGAARAVRERGASLLARGVVGVEGNFGEGDVVEMVEEGEVFARGVCVYGAEEIRRIMGCHSDEIEQVLGYRVLDAVVHRDAMVVMEVTRP